MMRLFCVLVFAAAAPVFGQLVVDTYTQKLVSYTTDFGHDESTGLDSHLGLAVLGAWNHATSKGEAWVFHQDAGTKLWTTTPDKILSTEASQSLSSFVGRLATTDGTHVAVASVAEDDLKVYSWNGASWTLLTDFSGVGQLRGLPANSFPTAIKMRSGKLFACHDTGCGQAYFQSGNWHGFSSFTNKPSQLSAAAYYPGTLSMTADGEHGIVCTFNGGTPAANHGCAMHTLGTGGTIQSVGARGPRSELVDCHHERRREFHRHQSGELPGRRFHDCWQHRRHGQLPGGQGLDVHRHGHRAVLLDGRF